MILRFGAIDAAMTALVACCIHTFKIAIGTIAICITANKSTILNSSIVVECNSIYYY
jgi:hypothetical protein